MTHTDQFVTLEEAEVLSGKSKRTLFRHCKEGILPYETRELPKLHRVVLKSDVLKVYGNRLRVITYEELMGILEPYKNEVKEVKIELENLKRVKSSHTPIKSGQLAGEDTPLLTRFQFQKDSIEDGIRRLRESGKPVEQYHLDQLAEIEAKIKELEEPNAAPQELFDNWN